MASRETIMKNIIAVALLIFITKEAHSQIVGSEICPKMTLAEGIKYDDLTGVWYENRKYAAEADNITGCTEFVFGEPEKNLNRLPLTIEASTKPDAHSLKLHGTATPITGTFSKYLVEFKGTGLLPTNYHVLSYSPKQWLLIWVCSDYDYFHVQQTHLLTHERIPPKSVVEAALAAAKTNGIPRWIFKITDQYYC